MMAVSCEASREASQVLSKHVICEAPGGGNMRGNRQDWRGAGRSYEGDTGQWWRVARQYPLCIDDTTTKSSPPQWLD